MILIEFYDYLYLFDNYGRLIGFRMCDESSIFFYNENINDLNEIVKLIDLPKLEIDDKQLRLLHKQQLCDLFQVLAESGESYVLSLNNNGVDLYNWLTTHFKNEINIIYDSLD